MADGGNVDTRTARVSGEEALAMHACGRPGKLETRITKPMTTARDLSLAYSPGVAEPCLHIARDPSLAYDYTTKGNMVAVISNGTAVLGLGNLGAVASKPVMEGKVALFKRFADIDGIDLEIGTEDVDEFVNAVRYLRGFGGINLEDIKAPECFVIEQRLRELMDIPVFHDDQHGTAIVAAAGLINACHLTGRELRDTKLVVNGAGAAAIACVELLQGDGHAAGQRHPVRHQGRVYQGRTDGHEPVEVGPRRRHQGAHADRGHGGRRRVLWPFGEGRADPGHGAPHGGQADHLRHGQPRSRDHAGGGARRPARTRSSPPGAATIRTRSTTSSAFPTSSAARWTCAPARSTRR